MQIDKYLEKNQPIIYKSFANSLQNKHLSHAYLLVGNPGTPLFDVAKFLAKSILCDNSRPLACDNCMTCVRVDENNYPDLIILDGSKTTIKKDDVASIESRFDKKAFEAKGIMIYILHLVENMTVEAINSILKFLEEPENEVYAFLTTNNENSVLPTIISRCQTMHLKLVPRTEVINDAISLGVEESDAEFLSYFYNDGELINDVLKDEDRKDFYSPAKEAISNLLNTLANCSKNEAIFYYQSQIIPTIKTKESARFFIDMLIECYEDLLNIKNQKPIYLKSYDTILKNLCDKLCHIDDSLIEILKQRNIINTNVNIPLLLDHIIFYILKEN